MVGVWLGETHGIHSVDGKIDEEPLVEWGFPHEFQTNPCEREVKKNGWLLWLSFCNGDIFGYIRDMYGYAWYDKRICNQQ